MDRRHFLVGCATVLSGCGVDGTDELFVVTNIEETLLDGGKRVDVTVARNGQARNVRVTLRSVDYNVDELAVQTVINGDQRTATFYIQMENPEKDGIMANATNPDPDEKIRDPPVRCYGSHTWCSQFSEPES